MAEPVMRLEGVVKEYGDKVRTRVLHGIDLQFLPGEFAAVTGPSGSGKSTLLNLMGLLDRPTAGRVVVDGQDTTKLAPDALSLFRGRRLGFIFQFHHLLPAFTVRENVYMPLMAQKGRPDREMAKRADELLEAVGLSHKADALASDLSGGQQQRVAIARALAPRPALVLADEPTGNLDTETSDVVFDLMRRINAEQGTAFVIVTHDPRLGDRCDRIVRVVDGRIASDERGKEAGPCRVCGYGPCLRDACVRSADIPRPLGLPLA